MKLNDLVNNSCQYGRKCIIIGQLSLSKTLEPNLHMDFTTEFSIHDRHGQRKYLNQQERLSFSACAKQYPEKIRLFCLMMYWTGARISEIVNLNVSQIDFSNKTVIIQTLKRRKKSIYRQIHLPDFLLDELKSYIGTRAVHDRYSPNRVWFFSVRTASRYIKAVMNKAGIDGHKASARGLRHGFAVQTSTMMSISQIQVLLGHANLQMTAIYTQVSGAEERKLFEKLWAAG